MNVFIAFKGTHFLFLFVGIKLLHMSFTVSEASEVKVHISDSIAKYVEGIRQAEVTSFPGININQLANKIRKEH